MDRTTGRNRGTTAVKSRFPPASPCLHGRKRKRATPPSRGRQYGQLFPPGESDGKCSGALGEYAVQQAQHSVPQHLPACARIASHDQRQGITIPLGPHDHSLPEKTPPRIMQASRNSPSGVMGSSSLTRSINLKPDASPLLRKNSCASRLAPLGSTGSGTRRSP